MCVPLSESHRLCFCQDRVQSCCVPGSVYCIIIVCYGVFLGLCGIIIMWFISESVYFIIIVCYGASLGLYCIIIVCCMFLGLHCIIVMLCVCGSVYCIIIVCCGVFLGPCTG